MPTYRIDLEYDGSDFHGWQIQPGRRTVQGELARALATLCREAIVVEGAGRTDAGVHALGQVAGFRAESAPEARRFLRGLNALLPADVRVRRLARVPDAFSARHSALWRRYRYQMLRRPSALERRFHHVLTTRVEPKAMQAAAAVFVGEHDFSAVAKIDGADAARVCRVLKSEVRVEGARIVFDITANRFLHNMVRRLAGLLVEVGRGRLRPEDAAAVLAARDTSRGGPCLGPAGLFLVEVAYPAEYAGTEGVVDGDAGAP